MSITSLYDARAAAAEADAEIRTFILAELHISTRMICAATMALFIAAFCAALYFATAGFVALILPSTHWVALSVAAKSIWIYFAAAAFFLGMYLIASFVETELAKEIGRT